MMRERGRETIAKEEKREQMRSIEQGDRER